jgi:NAD(P)H-hydrate epimerase
MTPPRSFSAGLTSAQVTEVDRLAEGRFGIPVEWLMEAAGWQVSRFCRGRTAVLCGKGSNGGDGLAAARHLHRRGLLHSVSALDRGAFRGAAAREASALEAAGVAIGEEANVEGADLVLDAVFGTGLTRPPEGRAADWIQRLNSSGLRVVAVDLPSGLAADDGRAYEPVVRADLTVTLGLPKAGLLKGDGPRQAGEVWVVDIGIPPEAYAMVGAVMPEGLFAEDDRVQMAAGAQ